MNTKILALVMLRLLSKPSFVYFGTPEEDKAAAEEAAKKAAEEAEAKKNEKRFSQADLDKHVGSFKFKMTKEAEKQAEELKKLSEDKRLTQEERDTYAKRLDEVEGQYKTAKELEEQRVKKISDDHKKEKDSLAKERDTYKTMYESQMIDVELSTESATADEAVPGQLKKLLKPDTYITDTLGDDGKPTGKKEVRVKYEDVDKDGKPTELKLTVKEVVKKMKETPDRFGNLFKGTGVGGVGAANSKGGAVGGKMPTDPEAYIATRRAQDKAARG